MSQLLTQLLLLPLMSKLKYSGTPLQMLLPIGINSPLPVLLTLLLMFIVLSKKLVNN